MSFSINEHYKLPMREDFTPDRHRLQLTMVVGIVAHPLTKSVRSADHLKPRRRRRSQSAVDARLEWSSWSDDFFLLPCQTAILAASAALKYLPCSTSPTAGASKRAISRPHHESMNQFLPATYSLSAFAILILEVRHAFGPHPRRIISTRQIKQSKRMKQNSLTLSNSTTVARWTRHDRIRFSAFYGSRASMFSYFGRGGKWIEKPHPVCFR